MDKAKNGRRSVPDKLLGIFAELGYVGLFVWLIVFIIWAKALYDLTHSYVIYPLTLLSSGLLIYLNVKLFYWTLRSTRREIVVAPIVWILVIWGYSIVFSH